MAGSSRIYCLTLAVEHGLVILVSSTHILQERTNATIEAKHTTLEKLVANKWRGILPASFHPKWKEVWLPNNPIRRQFLYGVYIIVGLL